MAWMLIAALVLAQGSEDEAVRLNNEGVELLKAKKPAEAVAVLERALKLGPGQARIRENLVNALLDEAVAALNANRPADAEPRARRAREVAPENAHVAHVLGTALYRLDQREEAETPHRPRLARPPSASLRRSSSRSISSRGSTCSSSSTWRIGTSRATAFLNSSAARS